MSIRFPQSGARVVAMVDDWLQPATIAEALKNGSFLIAMDDGSRRILLDCEVGDPTPLTGFEVAELRVLALRQLHRLPLASGESDQLMRLRQRVAMTRILGRLEAQPMVLNTPAIAPLQDLAA